MKAAIRFGVLLAGAVLLAGCSTALMRADEEYRAGNYAGAASAYQQALDRGGDWMGKPKALFRLGVVKAQPGTPSYDPAAARKAFETLQASYPGSTYARQATLPLSLLKAMQSATERSSDLGKQVADLKARLDQQALAAGREAAKSQEDQQAELLKLRARMAEQERTIERLEHELEQLKHIDLGRPR